MQECLVLCQAPSRKLVEIVHDECAFNANDDRRVRWTNEVLGVVLKPKGRGKGLMISGFVTEIEGILRDEDGKPCVEIIEYGKAGKGYWTNATMAAHLRRAIRAAEYRFPFARLVWRFDNSSNHLAYGEDALVANRMQVRPGGSQPVMHDTIWKGKVQKMVVEEGPNAGLPKGLRLILTERGYNVKGWRLDHKDPTKNYRKVIATHPDFQNEKSLLESIIIAAGHLCYFYPKFHPELSPIELFWAALKDYLRRHCGYNIATLRENVPKALDTICVEMIRRFFGKCRRYEAVYRMEQVESKDVAAVIKALSHRYHSHRRVNDVLTKYNITEETMKDLCSCSTCTGTTAQCNSPLCPTHAKK